MTKPLVSVVIPVHGVARYLGGCLDSVLGQSWRQVEVIAVDDHSPDESPAILDRRAARDPRLRVLHLDASRGPGGARNAGLARATGDYVWFVDGDDTLADGALAAVGQRLAAQPCDVLLVAHEEVYPSGRTSPDPAAALLGSVPTPVRLADRPELVNVSMTCWSKVFRLAFLRDLGVAFAPGIHEDVPVSACALLAAGRIGALDRVCYRYRRGRATSLTRAGGAAHFRIFDSYQQVFDFISERQVAVLPPEAPARPGGGPRRAATRPVAVTDAVRGAVFERAIWHYSVILATGAGIGPLRAGGMVPRRGRREYFARMSADFARLRPPGYRLPRGARGVKLRLIERGAWRTYSLLEPVNRLRVAAGRGVSARRLPRRTGRPRSSRPARSSRTAA